MNVVNMRFNDRITCKLFFVGFFKLFLSVCTGHSLMQSFEGGDCKIKTQRSHYKTSMELQDLG